jgi:murein DD-endopeptidase MepM/ murein hydrolase activator NlpD
MLKLASALIAGIIVVCIGLPVVLISAVVGGSGSGGGCGVTDTLPTDQPVIDGWDAEQVSTAAVIVNVGRSRGVPYWGWVVALATAMQESSLRNLPDLGDRNDHDSIGVFQQRPSQGWGTPQQLADPAYQAGKFYDKLLTIPGWQSMPLTQAAQAVQVSAFPDAYAKWADDAIRLADQLGGTAAMPTDVPTDLFDGCGSMTGWVQPVNAPIVSGFRTASRPTHDGVDLGAARGTPIRAASGGVVVRVRCNVNPASHGCDRDGSPQITGCGWYVDIHHEGDIYTRYCHMLTQPFVTVDQVVSAGQVIGIVGSSGNSSGPHLHYEVHLGDENSATAVDPVEFMTLRGAPLGT